MSARHPRLVLCTLLAMIVCSSQAVASPWILPDGVKVFQLTAGTEFATGEFLPDGTQQAFPLNGRFDSYFLQLNGRYGIGHNLELGLRTQFKGVSYTSDSVLLFDGDFGAADEAELRNSVFSFSRGAIGLSDIHFSLGYQHLDGAVRLASVAELKVPTGYQAPRATFRDDDPNPDNLTDDVTLGDGQLDLLYSLQAGIFINKTLTLIELNAGYNARFNGPGHQGLAQIKLGQAIDEHIFFFISARGAMTLFDGDTLGDGFIAIDPSVDANAFTTDNITTIPLTRDRDYLFIEGGAILRFSGRELIIQASRAILGANFPELTGVSIGTLLVFD